LHTVPSVGKNRAQSAVKIVERINPDVSAQAYPIHLDGENTTETLEGYDVVLECSGDPPTRYLVNDACVLMGKPLFITEMAGDWGRAMSVFPREGPCYRCAFPEPDLERTRSDDGYPDSLGGLMGLIQAAEIFKFLLGKGDLLRGKVLLLNGSRMRFHREPVERDRGCPVCGEHPTIIHVT
jgi:adenylyltransferase/sulfurtransferase